MARVVETIDKFAHTIHRLLLSDRDVVIGVGGFTGEGKSTFLTKLQKTYAKLANDNWDFSRMTWSRKELLTWIDGKKDTKKNEHGLREGQLPEYSAIMCDELFQMFYRRNWYEDEQIESIAVFNMCRDRHLFIGGNIPDFWDLDTAFTSRVRFYVYVPFRGIAWVFEQENNPFSTDKWNALDNKKRFRKSRNPYQIPNFLMELHFDDWTPDEKVEYLKIRNRKRVESIQQNKPEKIERYKKIKTQRDILIRLVSKLDPKMTEKEMAELIDMSRQAINLIKLNVR